MYFLGGCLTVQPIWHVKSLHCDLSCCYEHLTTFSWWKAPLFACRASRERWNMCNIHHWSCCGAEFGWFFPPVATLWRLKTQKQFSLCCLSRGSQVLTFEKFTWRRGGLYIVVCSYRRRFNVLGNFRSCSFFMLEALRLLLTLIRKRKVR